MKEPEGNIEYICSGCTDEIRREFHSTEHIIEVGDFVKATFVDHDEEAIEHMWVKVSKLINKEGSQIIRGVLYNQPATFVDHDEEAIEHMWVKVSKLINKEGSQIIRGVLYNQPALVQNVKYTDVVEVNYNDLLGHIKDNDNE
jgi:uncharacterized protein YegJ (DUF2314 family)